MCSLPQFDVINIFQYWEYYSIFYIYISILGILFNILYIYFNIGNTIQYSIYIYIGIEICLHLLGMKYLIGLGEITRMKNDLEFPSQDPEEYPENNIGLGFA